MTGKSWSYADDRRAIELAKASKSLEEAASIMKRTPERIRKVAMRLGISFKSESKKTLMPLKAAHPSANCDGPGGPLMSSRLAINVATYSPEEVLASAATERNIFRFSRCCVPRRSTPKDKGELLLLEGMCMIDDQQLARLRAHRNNILRYRNLLQTSLTELEREFVEKRLGEEQSALENLATILPNGAMNF